MTTPPLPDDRSPLYSGTVRGIEWAILMAPIGNSLNGYALIPDGHTVPMDDLAAPGGITYGYTTYNGDGDDMCEGWCGFDTGHHNDYWPPSEFREKIGIFISPQAMAFNTVMRELEAKFGPSTMTRTWTIETMIEATEDLATQIADHLGV